MKRSLTLIGTTLLAALASPAHAEPPLINYDSLSFLEEPLAAEIGDVTISLRGVIDAPVTFNMHELRDSSSDFFAGLQWRAETQLDNAIRLRATYALEFDSADDDKFDHKVTAEASSSYGKVSIGSVSDTLKHTMSRRLHAGNAELAHEEAFGTLREWAAAYLGTFGPFEVGAVVDQKANFEIGGVFQRPIGQTDIRLSARYGNGVFKPENTGLALDSHSVVGLAEVTYGSAMFDLGLGFENLSDNVVDANRVFVSGGVSSKYGALSLSAATQYGMIDGQDESSTSLGARYDIARGLSVNLGINHKHANVNVDGVQILDVNDTSSKLSLRYDF